MSQTDSELFQLNDYRRYGRQLILDGFGLSGQSKLQRGSVVVVGAGGLGCPALQYLAAAGVGKIAVLDHDTVDLSNLSRQILYDDSMIGSKKATMAANVIKKLNPRVDVLAITETLLPSNAIILLRPYDIIVDCTDNISTRYLLSDTAVLLGKPLVSGAAQKYDGQICTFNFGNSPCYRCLFPVPPPIHSTGSCEELGILGVVTGTIGTLQALEAIKILAGLHDGTPSLLLFSALGVPPFRTIKLRCRKATCQACGGNGRNEHQIQETDYLQFCGGPRPNWVELGQRKSATRITVSDLEARLKSGATPVIIDVRPSTEFGICHLPTSINIPLTTVVADPTSVFKWVSTSAEICVICRLGNDSWIAAEALRAAKPDITITDVIGGLRSWATDIDQAFPVY